MPDPFDNGPDRDGDGPDWEEHETPPAPVPPPVPPAPVHVTIPPDLAGERLDKALARCLPPDLALSRSAVAQLIQAGAVQEAGGTLAEAKRKVKPGETYRLCPPAPVPAEPQPEAIPLAVLHEDAHLIVVDKPAGMVVHPAPGAESGTLVNALLAHCGDTLLGIGGERRPGIVHRLDKDTSGALVAAKTAPAHAHLAAQFAERTIHRRYLALVQGDPERSRFDRRPGIAWEREGWLRIEAAIGRHPVERKRMAVREGGRHAVTRLRVIERFAHRPAVCLVECRLETGRTHQIRVHAAHIGHPLLGDPVYGPAAPAPGNLARQALHAADLGLRHPATGAWLQVAAPLPDDLEIVLGLLRRNESEIRLH